MDYIPYIILYNIKTFRQEKRQSAQMDSQRKSVEIYLRIKGPLNSSIKPQFKLLANDTKIRFKESDESEEQDIANQFAGVGMYRFQKIFREDAHQEDIYNRVARDLVQSAIQGYNGTIFAYGQTGSGKTYTMTGGDDDPSQMGIIPRVINELYRQAQTRQEQITIKLKYMQIYKKNGYDLLHSDSKSKKLQDLPQVRAFCKAENFEFQNLSQHEAPSFEQAMKIYEYGDTNRIVCKTPSNDQSSRSHCIFMIAIRTKNKDTGLQQKATINLVDLAGSERIHYSGMEQKQAKQGININLGLHYLSRVVLSLGQQSRGNHDVHVPYRDSLLTMALKSSMGGNCKTRMIATINPNPIFNPQNIATCKFSQNLLAMQNKLRKNQFINPWDIVKGLKNEVEQLKAEIARLKGEDVKQILEREDYVKIHKMVDAFLASSDPAETLPIKDRLYIRQYLSYMKNIIRSKPRKAVMSENENQNEVNFSTAISQNYIIEVKNLKQQIQQKENQIQLLLSLINHQKEQNPENLEDNYIPIEDSSQQKIAETIANSLLKFKKKRSYNVAADEVQKNLIKPILLNEQESVEEAFQKFKDAHVKSEEIDEKDHQIKFKVMKKQVILKKIKNMKNQRFKIQQKIQEISQQKRVDSLPAFQTGESKKQEILQLQQEIKDLDEKLKKKYQQLKAMQLEIDRLGLCKNKNAQRLKNQFQFYMQKAQPKDLNKQNNRSENSNSIDNIEQKSDKQQDDDKFEMIKPSLAKKQEAQSRPSSSRPSSSRAQQIRDRLRKVSGECSTREDEIEIKVDEKQVNKHMDEFFQARQKLYSNRSLK